MHEFEELIVWLDTETAKIPVKSKISAQKQKNYFN
jgi:hypothetical protein